MANSIPKIVYNNGVTDVTIQFEYPPLGLDYEGININQVSKTVEATNGAIQAADNFQKEERTLTFRQVNQTIRDELYTFMTTHGLKYKTFKYFVDSDEVTFITVTIDLRQNDFRPKRTGWNPSNIFTYEIQLRLRRVL